MTEATKMLNADRATLFLHDPKTSELFSRVAMGDNVGEIRLPDNVGIAGSVFQSRETVNIPHAYADLRFNPAFDKNIYELPKKLEINVPTQSLTYKTTSKCTDTLERRGGTPPQYRDDHWLL